MDNSTINSLVYVVEMGAAQVRKLGERLETATPRQLEPILRSLAKEADTLSAGLSRLSQHVEEMPLEETEESKEAPVVDRRMLEFSTLFKDAVEHGFCERCDGVQRDNHGDCGRIIEGSPDHERNIDVCTPERAKAHRATEDE